MSSKNDSKVELPFSCELSENIQCPKAFQLPPPKVKAEESQESALEATGLQSGARSDEYEEYKREFKAVTNGAGKLTETEFIGHAALQHWGVDHKTAQAAFAACDVDGSHALSVHEYALLRAALTAYNKDVDADKPLWELRVRTLFAKYDEGGKASLNLEDRRELLRELVQGDTHINALLQAMNWSDNAKPLDLKQFAVASSKGGILEQTARLSIADGMGNDGAFAVQKQAKNHLVIDGRAVVAEAPLLENVNPRQSTAVQPSSLNESFRMAKCLRAPHGSCWRGSLAVPRDSELQRIAQSIIDQAAILAHIEMCKKAPDPQVEIADNEWMLEGEVIERLLGTNDKERQTEIVLNLASYAERVVAAEPTLVRVPTSPAKIFGDTHGQFRDLILLLVHHGFPTHKGGDIELAHYVFNGDYTDRGAHQIEVVLLVLALKILYPSRVFLLRGNHEFRSQNEGMGKFGFQHAVTTHFKFTGEKIYDAIHRVFDQLPLAALVADSILVLHGGIGDGSWNLSDLAAVKRPIKSEREGPRCVLDSLWSDPSDSDATMARGVHGNPRGRAIKTFGPDITAKFCHDNYIQLIVRSHQYVPDGVKFMHGGHLATVFSARNYFNKSSNDGAFLLVAMDELGALRVRVKRLANLRGT